MLGAAIFPQKYDGRVMPPEMNQGCSEGRRGGELRVHTMGGRWTCVGGPWKVEAPRASASLVAGGVDRRSEWSLSPGCMR